MTLYTGMIIKTFPETDVKAYVRMIQENGYRAIVNEDSIRVGMPYHDMKIDGREFARLVRRKRREKGLTREQLCKIMKVCEQTEFDWEVGRRLPRPETMTRLMNELDISKGEMECLTKKPSM